MLSYNLNVSTANSFKQLLLKQTPSAPAVGAKKFFHLSEILLFTLIVFLSLFPITQLLYLIDLCQRETLKSFKFADIRCNSCLYSCSFNI